MDYIVKCILSACAVLSHVFVFLQEVTHAVLSQDVERLQFLLTNLVDYSVNVRLQVSI